FSDVYSLQRKSLSGAGLPAEGLEWTYTQMNGPGPIPHWWGGQTVPCTDCEERKTVRVSNPDGSATDHQFGVVYGLNEGKLLQSDQLAIGGSLLRREVTDYICGNNSLVVPCGLRYG